LSVSNQWDAVMLADAIVRKLTLNLMAVEYRQEISISAREADLQ
jgi:hypothetical protein